MKLIVIFKLMGPRPQIDLSKITLVQKQEALTIGKIESQIHLSNPQS